jgi:hypothetical protein
MSIKAAVLIAAVILLLVLVCSKETFEHLRGQGTRIFRTTGVYNEADEVRLPPGIIVSVPVFDYTHTYWDGKSNRSCDECPSKFMCPNCPKYKENMGNGLVTGIGPLGVDSRTGMMKIFNPDSLNSGFTVGEMVDKAKEKTANYFNTETARVVATNTAPMSKEHYDMHGIRPINIDWDPLMQNLQSEKMASGCSSCGNAINLIYDSPDTHGVSNKPSVDFSSGMPSYLDQDQVEAVLTYEGDDPDFWSGRGKLGGCKGGPKCSTYSKYSANVAYLGTKNDDFFDGERAMVLGLMEKNRNCNGSSVKMMQQNRLDRIAKDEGYKCNTNNCAEEQKTREFLGEQGYVYKETGMY